MEYAAYRAVARLLRSASDQAVVRWGSRLGALARIVVRRRDRLAMRNLRMAFPGKTDKERRRILDACWRHFGREALEGIHTQHLSAGEILQRCTMVNAELLDEGIARGRGVLLISAHYGSWEVGGLALTSRLRNVRTVARPLDNEFLERDLARIRERTGAEVVDRKRAARSLFKALSDNGVVVLLPDQAVQPREGVLVPFMNLPAWTTDAPAKMALRLGSTIVFGFCIPDGIGHRLEFEEPIQIDQLSNGEKDATALTGRINEVISRRIAAHPELWLWMHDRWKGTTPGEGTTSDDQ
ncbi:MAG: lysophospholipid acyltransferase family protein [Acidobacteriota bacterium]